ncbi:MAG: helix-turn-helix domain-containing protein [bacterium]|nr:helix-turn-helix domain-containing protein [bacterium]
MGGGSILKERILTLRRKRKSYKEIAEILDVAKSTVSYWISNNPESRVIKDILTKQNIIKSRRRIRKIIKLSKEKWAAWREVARKEALRNFPATIKNPLFVAGITIYWGEGDSKPKNPMRISNTDPRMISVYIHFLREVMLIPDEKIRMGLILYPDLSDAVCKKFWARVSGLDENHFMKTQYIKGYHPTKRLSHGICMVVVNSRQNKVKILEWIDLFHKKYKIN